MQPTEELLAPGTVARPTAWLSDPSGAGLCPLHAVEATEDPPGTWVPAGGNRRVTPTFSGPRSPAMLPA